MTILTEKWPISVFNLEIRKLLSYRVDFWLNFLGATLFQVLVAYFLWDSIYSLHHQDKIQGLSFKGMMFYYVLSPLISKMIMGQQMGNMSVEIYSGELTRYLLYPLSFFRYKLTTHLANSTFSMIQFFLGLVFFFAIFGFPGEFVFKFSNLCLGIFIIFIGSILFFTMSSCLEMVAFWADHVWTLMVMLRFIISLLGGSMLPLVLYPEWAQNFLQWLPFHYLISFPILIIQGKISWTHIIPHLFAMAFWILVFSQIARLIWKKATQQYTGVGI